MSIAVNGKVARDMIAKEQYDLCLIDIRLPAMDGKELYQWLQEKQPQLANRVIFTTGDMMDEDIKGFLEQVAKPFLPKPFTPNEMKAIVRETWKEVEE